MANCFWSRWRKEYLQLLQSRQKWTKKQRNLQTDDVVLLKEEGAGRGHWPMARVVEAHHSKDGLVRSVSLRVKDSILKRLTEPMWTKRWITKIKMLIGSEESWERGQVCLVTRECEFW